MSKTHNRSVYTWHSLVRRNTHAIDSADSDGHGLSKCLTAVDLIGYGIGSTVGAGIFVSFGLVAKEHAGPGIILSFLYSGFACLLSAFCYSEFAASIPISGSAYTFAYAALGELLGWFIGWDLSLEYSISAAAVARSWASTIAGLINILGGPDLSDNWFFSHSINSVFNISLASLIIIVICTVILIVGVKESARFNLVVSIINVSTILFIIILGLFHIDPANWHPFLPYGISGTFSGAGIVFFSYVGFDSVSALAGEVRTPARDLPIGIVGTLGIATVLYVMVSLVATGMVNFAQLNKDTPISSAFESHGVHWAAIIVAFGSLTAITATTLCSLLGQPRIYFSMAKDGLLWPQFAQVSKSQTPVFGTLVTACIAGVFALVLDFNALGDMISIGTLLAFSVVCAGVVAMRMDKNGMYAARVEGGKGASEKDYLLRAGKSESFIETVNVPVLLVTYFLVSCFLSLIIKYNFVPYWCTAFPGVILVAIYAVLQLRKQVNIPPTFKCPLVPLLPLLAVLVNAFLITQLSWESILRVVVWSLIGFAIYFSYGIHHSKLNYLAPQHIQNHAKY